MLFRRYSTTITSTILSSIEQISVELFYVLLFIPTITLASITLPVAGAILLLIYVIKKNKILVLNKRWKYLLVLATIFALTEFTWYDAISRVGAAKTALVNLPLEIVFVLFFAWVFLRECLNTLQFIGAAIVIIGIILSMVSDVSAQKIMQFGIGEVEIIITSLLAAVNMVMVTKLLKESENTLETTAFILIFSGLILNISWLFYTISDEIPYILIVYPLVPAFMFLTQFESMKRVGVSITSIVLACAIMLTLLIQIILSQFNVPVVLPENLILSIIGGVISIGGIICVFWRDNVEEKKN